MRAESAGPQLQSSTDQQHLIRCLTSAASLPHMDRLRSRLSVAAGGDSQETGLSVYSLTAPGTAEPSSCRGMRSRGGRIFSRAVGGKQEVCYAEESGFAATEHGKCATRWNVHTRS